MLHMFPGVWSSLCACVLQFTPASLEMPSVSLNYPTVWQWMIALCALVCVKATVYSLRSAVWTVLKWWKAHFRCFDKAGLVRPIIVTFQNQQADSHTCALARCAQVWKWGELQMWYKIFSPLLPPVTSMLATEVISCLQGRWLLVCCLCIQYFIFL